MVLFVFDYDDTLCCSTYLTQQVIQNIRFNIELTDIFLTKDFLVISPILLPEIIIMEDASMSILSCALTLGEVAIITNAKLDWVQYSLEIFFPRLLAFLLERSIPIVSAQDLFSSSHPHQPLQWKIQSFKELSRHTQGRTEEPLCMISIGDGLHEKQACQMLCATSLRTATVLLHESPSSRQLTAQLGLLEDLLPTMVKQLKSEAYSGDHVDVRMHCLEHGLEVLYNSPRDKVIGA